MRFTLKTLFVAVFVVGLVCCVFFAMPDWLSFSILALLSFPIPPVLIAGRRNRGGFLAQAALNTLTRFPTEQGSPSFRPFPIEAADTSRLFLGL